MRFNASSSMRYLEAAVTALAEHSSVRVRVEMCHYHFVIRILLSHSERKINELTRRKWKKKWNKWKKIGEKNNRKKEEILNRRSEYWVGGVESIELRPWWRASQHMEFQRNPPKCDMVSLITASIQREAISAATKSDSPPSGGRIGRRTKTSKITKKNDIQYSVVVCAIIETSNLVFRRFATECKIACKTDEKWCDGYCTQCAYCLHSSWSSAFNCSYGCWCCFVRPETISPAQDG